MSNCYLEEITVHVSPETNLCELINILEQVKEINPNATVRELDYYGIKLKISNEENQ